MFFIAAKFHVQPEYADQWPEITGDFTKECRREPGCMWFSWSRSLDDSAEYVVVEAFRDNEAFNRHTQYGHFKNAQQTLPRYLVRTPGFVGLTVPGNDWSPIQQMAVPGSD